MTVINDKNCTWINDLSKRKNINVLNKNINCDYLIVGAGFTGLSAARKISELQKESSIIIVDAQLAGEGASGRNSGYLVDTTLNDGFNSNKELISYKNKTDIYKLGIDAVKKFVTEHQVDCDWNECGKYFASSQMKDEKRLLEFSNILSNLQFKHEILFKSELNKRLGTNFYNIALFTKGGILINPGKLARAMIDHLPSNVKLFENSPLKHWEKDKNHVDCYFSNSKIVTKKIIFATNGFLRSIGVKSAYNFPITLTASMTRPLTDEEFSEIGKPKEWGVLPVRPMGATIRMTKDRRILIRNTAEFKKSLFMSHSEIIQRSKYQKIGIKKRFPMLPENIVQSTWSGIVSRSRNSSQIFEKINENIFVAGTYNGSGIGVGTLFGEQIAIKVVGDKSKEIEIIENKKKPNLLPPEPILSLAVKAKLFYERIKARTEI
mgnify:CR=1 FL=1